jgi:ESS family glutamate:Na+ symporter
MIDLLTAILLLAICVELGDLVNRYLFDKGVLVPGFLTALFTGIVLTNLIATTKISFDQALIGRFGDVSLQIFLAMSLMSMKLWVLSGAAGPVMLVLLVQVTVMTLFAVYIVFYVMGRDYDAVVIASGFAGMGLGATPVAIANMTAITGRFGPSPKALLIVPMVGAFFIDILNAVTIKAFIGIITNWFA